MLPLEVVFVIFNEVVASNLLVSNPFISSEFCVLEEILLNNSVDEAPIRSGLTVDSVVTELFLLSVVLDWVETSTSSKTGLVAEVFVNWF